MWLCRDNSLRRGEKLMHVNVTKLFGSVFLQNTREQRSWKAKIQNKKQQNKKITKT